jgi:hypothetical protein
MVNNSAMLRGIIRGKTIELELEPGLEDGQEVSVEIRPIAREAAQPEQLATPPWLEQLDVDPAVRRGKFVVKGTSLLVDTLVEQLEAGEKRAGAGSRPSRADDNGRGRRARIFQASC